MFGGRPFDPRNFLSETTTVAEASSVLMIVFPELVEYREGVFLKFAFSPANVDVWLNELGDDVSAAEAVVNHVHLWDVFSPNEEREYAALSEFAHRMAQIWRACLRETFPNRQFEVTVSDDPSDYGTTVTFASV